MKCNVCGSANLIEGTIVAAETRTGVYIFEPSDKPYFKRMLGIGGRETRSFPCVNCGNLQFVVDFNDEDRKQYAAFEGEQPSLMERLDEESNRQK